TAAVPLALATNAAPAPAARDVNPQVPAELSAVIAKALERRPDDRYESAKEFDDALARLSTARPTPLVLDDSRSTWKWIALAVVIAMATVAVTMRMSGRLVWTGSAGVHPAFLAILPVDNPSGDVRAEQIGAGIAALLRTNLGSIPGLSVLPQSATTQFQDRRNDLAALRRESGATLVADLGVRTTSPQLVVFAALRRTDRVSNEWEQMIEGDVLKVEQTLLDGLGRALERAVSSHRLTTTEWTRVRTLPTTSASALQAYSEARALLDRADVAGNITRAIELLKQATKDDARFADAYAALGDAQWALYSTGIDRRPEVAASATASVMEALKLDPDLAPVHYALANMQYQTGRYQEAMASLRRALAIRPDNDDAHRLLGRVMVATGDVDGGLAEVRRAIELRPYWNNYYILGYVLYTTGRYREAIAALTKTTELQPTFSNAFQMLGTTYHMLGDLPQAIGNYEHAARLGPNAGAYANLAMAYYSAGHYDQARDSYLDAIKKDERKASLRRDLGDVYTRLGRDAEARAMYEKAIQLAQDDLKVNPRNANAVALIALCEAKIGRREAAARHAAEAAVLAPGDRDVRIFLAKVYNAIGDRKAGLTALQTAVMLGFEPTAARGDDELAALRDDARFETAISAGVAARSRSGSKGATR
ncbi:MAG TPA: tetratricopeptide repeat protein, partial [Candidatus Cybelea sp.]|nr:tetratricopeptide repeat protein [Candidatus Cybelea sp.]